MPPRPPKGAYRALVGYAPNAEARSWSMRGLEIDLRGVDDVRTGRRRHAGTGDLMHDRP